MPGPARNKYLPQDEILSQTKNSTLSLKFLYIFVFDLVSITILFLSHKMLCFPSSCFLLPSSNTILKHPPPQLIQQTSITSIKLKAAAAASDTPQVDYNSMASSVFPAEACETLGGVACDVEMFPETKLKEVEPNPKITTTTTSSQTVDREYVEYILYLFVVNFQNELKDMFIVRD